MDKELARRVFRAEGLPQVDYLVVRRCRWERERDALGRQIAARLGFPVFVKPVSLGSSVGVSRAETPAQLAMVDRLQRSLDADPARPCLLVGEPGVGGGFPAVAAASHHPRGVPGTAHRHPQSAGGSLS